MARYRITPNMTPTPAPDRRRQGPLGWSRMRGCSRLLAMVGDDAGIATAEAKLHYNFWRPITAIRNASDDGNDATAEDPAWEPLIATPNHPEYPCAHCTFAAVDRGRAQERGRRRAAGRGPGPFALDPQQHRPGLPSLDEWVREVSVSRTYGGVHYRFSNEAGEEIGRKVARDGAGQGDAAAAGEGAKAHAEAKAGSSAAKETGPAFAGQRGHCVAPSPLLEAPLLPAPELFRGA